MKHIIQIIFFCFLSQIRAQNNDIEIRDLFSSIVFISDTISVKKNIKGKQNNIKALKFGSGFLIYKHLDTYLVTAAHVAKDLSINTMLTYQSINGKKREVGIKKLLNNAKTINWILHPTADIAILHIPLKVTESDNFYSLNLNAISYAGIMDELEVPDRLKEVTVFGFPLGLGVSKNKIAPITKNLRPASDILYLPRFDNKISNPFFLLDDPSISGFSGGPVMQVHVINNNKKIRERFKIQPTITGLVHGTINGRAGGFAAIVPGKLILETIDMAPSYNGVYIFKYPNGSLWSEVIYKNGIPWEVISNFDPNGNAQDKGSLKNGNGELFIYDETGKKEVVQYFKNGKYVKYKN